MTGDKATCISASRYTLMGRHESGASSTPNLQVAVLHVPYNLLSLRVGSMPCASHPFSSLVDLAGWSAMAELVWVFPPRPLVLPTAPFLHLIIHLLPPPCPLPLHRSRRRLVSLMLEGARRLRSFSSLQRLTRPAAELGAAGFVTGGGAAGRWRPNFATSSSGT